MSAAYESLTGRLAAELRDLRALAVTIADQVQGVYAPVHCDDCRLTRPRIGAGEVEPLIVDGQLPCPCGSYQTYVGGAALGEVR